MIDPAPFRISIPDAAVDGLRRRLIETRWAEDFGNADWRYGVESGWLKEMVDYWRDSFDWRAQEARINRWPQFRMVIEDIPIHFIYVRGQGPSPMPLILTHGWPWTFWDYGELIGPLTDPLAHGGRAEDSFDLVIPSLPGYGFSTPLRSTGIDVPAIARLWVTLMRDGLGYQRFGAGGGDWGAAVTAHLGHAHADAVLGIHQTLPVVPGLDFTGMGAASFAEDEQWMAARNAEAYPLIASHITVHSHDPQTLAYALSDSPVGLAAWLWERRRAWSDCEGDILSAFDRDFLCTTASIYWFTNSIGSSMRLYWEHFSKGMVPPLAHDRKPTIEVPAGYAIFPKEVTLIPRSWVEQNADLRRWTIMRQGGHFGPAEQPQPVVEELREFFRPLRS